MPWAQDLAWDLPTGDADTGVAQIRYLSLHQGTRAEFLPSPFEVQQEPDFKVQEGITHLGLFGRTLAE